MSTNLTLVTATGASGAVYQFQIWPVGTVFLPNAGVYIFGRDASGGLREVLYVGETDSFKRRLTDELTAHHQHDRARSLGLNHIAVLHVPGPREQRLKIETDLRHALNPPCNDQANALLTALLKADKRT